MPDSPRVLDFRTLTLTAFIYLALVCFFALLGLTALDWYKYQHLAQNAVKTIGRVTGKEPQNHYFIRYIFQVDHRSFFGIGNAGGENPPFDELEVGAPVTVYYDSENPKSSFLGNPKRQADSATAGVLFSAVVGPLMCMLGLYMKRWLPIFS